MAYTYDDFVKAATDAGVLNSMNQYDMSTAKNNPEFGLSMVSLQKDLNGATTTEQKLLATEAANQLRKTYGGYNIGEDGSYNFAGSYGQAVRDQLGKVTNPTPFSYDAENDPTFQQYRKTYLREGDRASENTLGQAAAMTQGRPSSYAVNAAAQANNYYDAKLADSIPTLRQNAYTEYLQGLQQDATQLDALRAQDETEYQRYLKGLDIQNQELSNAMAMYQMFKDKSPDWVLNALNLKQEEKKKSSGGGGWSGTTKEKGIDGDFSLDAASAMESGKTSDQIYNAMVAAGASKKSAAASVAKAESLEKQLAAIKPTRGPR